MDRTRLIEGKFGWTRDAEQRDNKSTLSLISQITRQQSPQWSKVGNFLKWRWSGCRVSQWKSLAQRLRVTSSHWPLPPLVGPAVNHKIHPVRTANTICNWVPVMDSNKSQSWQWIEFSRLQFPLLDWRRHGTRRSGKFSSLIRKSRWEHMFSALFDCCYYIIILERTTDAWKG